MYSPLKPSSSFASSSTAGSNAANQNAHAVYISTVLQLKERCDDSKTPWLRAFMADIDFDAGLLPGMPISTADIRVRVVCGKYDVPFPEANSNIIVNGTFGDDLSGKSQFSKLTSYHVAQ